MDCTADKRARLFALLLSELLQKKLAFWCCAFSGDLHAMIWGPLFDLQRQGWWELNASNISALCPQPAYS
jgi:hypothetical protein